MGRMNRNSSNSSHKKKSSRGRRIRPPGNNEGNPDHPPPPPRASSWVDRLRFVPVPPPPPHRDTTGTDPHDHHTNNSNTDTPTTTGSGSSSSSSNDNNTPTPTISIMTWNILAQAYCRRDSQVQLPHIYNQVVFHKVKRKQRLLQLLPYLTGLGNNNNNVDVLCLQEVDVNEIRPVLYQHGFTSVMETPRSQRPVNQHMTSRIDGCATYIRTNNTSDTATTNTTATTAATDNIQNDTADTDSDSNNHNHNNMDHPPPQPPPPPVQWKLLDSELIRLDDLATLSSSSTPDTASSTRTATADTSSSSNTHNNNNNNNHINHHHVLQGIQQSLLRRNMAILVRLQHVQFPERTILVVNAHLFWNPSFEYVKVRTYVCMRVLWL
jgi:mRNA deadenylase 3'-5' endonuclease subunit Ccr4